MAHQFVTQPLVYGYDLQEFIEEACADAEIERLDLVVAWVKSSGVLGIQGTIEAFRRRAGFVRGVVGISLGGTSKQGLALAREAFDELYVFHEPGRTFHPKVYLASGPRRARALVGSNNLTRGGLSRNYEAAVRSDLDLSDEADRAYHDSLRDFIDGLVSEVELCLEATPEFVERLLASYRLFDEDAEIGPDDAVDGPRAEEEPAVGDSAGERLFGSRRRPMRPERTRPSAAIAGSATGRAPRGYVTPATPIAPPSSFGGAAEDPVVRRWYKQLEDTDAQQLHGKRQNPSNRMTLVQGEHAIDRQTYFREEFFGSETWDVRTTRTGRPQEEASVRCEVVVDGTSLGTFDFKVLHTPGYDSGQANRTTELVWPPDVGAYLRDNSMVGRIATLEKRRNGGYVLTIDATSTGEFIR